MGQNRSANDALRAAQLNELSYDATAGLAIGVNGMMMGPRGIRGETGIPGPMGIPMERYVLSYAGLPFYVMLKPDTFAMIEDATNLNGDELSLIKMVDEDEWKSIREAWSAAWIQRKAYSAFETGEMMPDE